MYSFDADQQALLRLACTDMLSLKKKFELIMCVDRPSGLFDGSAEDIPLVESARKELNDISGQAYYFNILNELRASSVTPIFYGDNLYPSKLYDLKIPPIVLFARGDTSLLGKNMLAVVGSRKVDSYSRQVTEHFVRGIGSRDIVVISGMARGVDSIAHNVAFDNNIPTIAVLGSGIDVCYPPENHALYHRLCTEGLVLSEYFCDVTPLNYHFPERNRIVAALCDILLVTQAGEGSGALITADIAGELNKKVYAVCGSIFSDRAKGSNAYITDGKAQLVTDVQTILSDFGAQCVNNMENPIIQLNFEEDMVYNALRDEDRHFDELLALTGLSSSELNTLLMNMELKGLLTRTAGNYYSLHR